jgi:hypothetical protein
VPFFSSSFGQDPTGSFVVAVTYPLPASSLLFFPLPFIPYLWPTESESPYIQLAKAQGSQGSCPPSESSMAPAKGSRGSSVVQPTRHLPRETSYGPLYLVGALQLAASSETCKAITIHPGFLLQASLYTILGHFSLLIFQLGSSFLSSFSSDCPS